MKRATVLKPFQFLFCALLCFFGASEAHAVMTTHAQGVWVSGSKYRVGGFEAEVPGRFRESATLTPVSAIGYASCAQEIASGRPYYCNGDPINNYDPDGRFGKAAVNYDGFHNVADTYSASTGSWQSGQYVSAVGGYTAATLVGAGLVVDTGLNATGVGELINAGLDVVKVGFKEAGNLLANQVEKSAVTDGAEAETQFTKSTLKLGQEMHSAYKADVVNNVTTFKEFRLPSGKRIDYLDIENGIIHELKPNNPRAIKAGMKQLEMYKNELQGLPEYQGVDWKTVLDTY